MGSGAAVGEGAVGGYAEWDAEGEGDFPVEGWVPGKAEDDGALVDGGEECANDEGGEEGAAEHGPVEKAATEAADLVGIGVLEDETAARFQGPPT